MVANFPGPYEIELSYTTEGHVHVLRINVDVVGLVSPGDLASTITLNTKDSLGVGLPAFITTFVMALQPLFSNTGTTFDSYTFWKYAPLSYEKTFITSDAISLNGTAASANTARHQLTFTTRTAEGGIHRLVLLEATANFNTQSNYLTAGPNYQALWDVMTANQSPVLGRDTSYLISPLRVSGGQNERLFRRDFR